jgi:CheY-like chemotaxis protein
VPDAPAAKRLLVVDENQELAEIVASAALRIGAASTLCRTGEEALASIVETQPHAAVVDLPLADVRGSEVLSALRRAGIPSVVVSGVYRGPHCAEEVVRLGAAAFFEKPFLVETLVDAVARLVGAALPAPAPEAEDEVTDADIVGEESPSGPRPAPSRPARPAPPDRGDLAATRVPRLLAAFHVAQATGVLTLQRGKVKRLLLFDRGVPVFASSNLPADRLGAFCVRRGLLTQAAREALARSLAPGERTADALLAKGILTEKMRAEIVAEQVRSIVWSTFEWRDGSYRFQVAALPRREIVKLALFPGDLILEGILRTAALPDLRRDLEASVALAPAPDPAFELYALGLRPAEAHLLALADGTKSVADLVALSELPERESLAFLYACRLMGVLDEVERVLAGTRRMAFM